MSFSPKAGWYGSLAEKTHVDVAGFQTDGKYTTNTFMTTKPKVGFRSFSICLKMFLYHYRGYKSTILEFGANAYNDEVFKIGTLCVSH